jgi:hypothetical protein
VNDLTLLSNVSQGLPLEGEIDSPRIADIELEKIGGHPLDLVAWLE